MSTPTSLGGLAEVVGWAGRADTSDPDAFKACCAAAYGVDLVGLFLGESYHPGGPALTRRLADLLAMQPGQRVLDVAAGIGTTAVLLAQERGVVVLGVDLGTRQVTRAAARARDLGLGQQVRFEVGDAERLPIGDATFDAVVCECALCTFPAKASAATELARAVRRGGRVGISDVWLDRGRLDPHLTGLVGRVACLADARPIVEVRNLLEDAGLRVDEVERHDDALAATIEQVETRLRALRLADLPALRPFNLRRGIDLAGRAAEAVQRGDAGYMLVTATKP
jgi:SAM-dependent methyltransferase